MSSNTSELTDGELVALVRAGDREAYGHLWQRHRGAALSVARQYANIADPEDIVQEATRAVLATMLTGGGPFGAFRPYLNQTVRNTAISMARRRTPHPVGDLHDVAERSVDDAVADPADGSLERLVTVRAFKALPPRWQAVLWLTCVEGMNVRDAGARLGLSPNATSALAVRAREGLRKEWLRAHLSDHRLTVTCRVVVEQLPALERGSLTPKDQGLVETHLRDCLHCSIIASEINDLATRLPVILAPLAAAGVDLFTSGTLRRHALLTHRRAVSRRGAHRVAHRSVRSMASGSGKAWAVGALMVGGVAAASGVAAHLTATPPIDVPATTTSTERSARQHEVLDTSPDGPEARSETPGSAASDAVVEATETTQQIGAPVAIDEDRSGFSADRPLADDQSPDTYDIGPGGSLSLAEHSDAGAPHLIDDVTDMTGSEAVDMSDASPVPSQTAGMPVPTVDQKPGRAAPLWSIVFAGTARAGGTVELLDTTGLVVARTEASDDGRWRISLLASEQDADPVTYSVRQVGQDGSLSPQEVVGTYSFTAPEIDARQSGPSDHQDLPRFAVWIHGTPGMIQTRLDDRLGIPRPLPGGLLVRLDGLGLGPHSFAVRYLNPWTGESGAWRVLQAVVPATQD